MKLKTTLLAAAATLLVAPAANAQGLYGAIGAGLNYMGYENEISVDSGAGPFPFSSTSEYDNGFGVYSSLGYDWGNRVRSELEFSYRKNDIAAIDPAAGFSGFPNGSIQGETETTALMANLLLDITQDTAITPYIGGGIGLARVHHQVAGSTAVGAPTSPLAIAYGDTDTVFAYQGIAGLAFDLAENLVLDLSYRYFAPVGVDAENSALSAAAATIETDAVSHSLFAGLRWGFGAAAPAAAPIQYKDCWDGSSVPVSVDCPPQIVEEQTADLEPIGFTVYFDYDKYNLTPQAANLVREAAGRALQNNIETVVVSGNTDTSGSSAYNQTLSERRARVVREALIANEVPADSIRTEAYGESNPAKPTSDGVREPLNRRSEVVISFE